MDIKVDLSKYSESNTITTQNNYQFVVGDIELDFNEISQVNDYTQILTKTKVSLIKDDEVIYEGYIVTKVRFEIRGISTITSIDVVHDITDKESLFYMINHAYYKNDDIETFSKIGEHFLKHRLFIYREISDELAESLIDIEQSITKTLNDNIIDVKLIELSGNLR